jgi:L-threonylcarbamoyladenylate synthase
MKYVKEVPEQAWDLISYSERPLTIIYPGAVNLPHELIANDGTIAIRVVKEGFIYELLKRFNRPITSTSANISGTPSPLHFDEIDEAILGSVDYVVDLQAAPDKSAEPSVIMKLETNGSFRFIRR